ncbi:hypothetical protein ABT404_08450 [Streptomyces hyaluromycini]|uniref:Uncharacterized protein n=1 Tax=Streptomyces hyaluromycini TaxID=1377993 RepID=A0ABV1WRL6_9ACTN
MEPAVPRRASRWQNAVRLLLLIATAAEPVTGDACAPPDAVGVVRTQVLLQKLDFWVRSPDYLAWELLVEYEAHPDDPALWQLARTILSSDEPDVRRYPMLRHRFGAFEQMDEALSMLIERSMVTKRHTPRGGQVGQHDYYLRARGRQVADTIVRHEPDLSWYVERTQTVVSLFKGLSPSGVKDRQYLQGDYADTPVGSYIVSITEQARGRLEELRPPAPGRSW